MSDTDRLEKEAEAHRSNLDSTFDAIRDRLSIGQIVDEFSGYLKEGQGADTVKNLGKQVRDNPLALGLVGAGLAWLFLGEGTRAKTHEASDRLSRWRDDREYDRFDQAFPPSDRGGSVDTSHPSYRRPVVSSGSTTRSASSSVSAGGPGIGDRVSGAASVMGDAGSRAASIMSDTVSEAGHSISDAAGFAANATRRGMHDAADAISSAGSSAFDGARRSGRQAYRAGSRAQRNIADLIHDEPLVFGAVAVAIGAAIGAMLPATRREDQWMGDTRDDLRDEAYERGRDTLHKAEHVAEKAYDAASEAAEDKGLKPDTTGAGSQTVAEKVADVAKSAASTVKEESLK